MLFTLPVSTLLMMRMVCSSCSHCLLTYAHMFAGDGDGEGEEGGEHKHEKFVELMGQTYDLFVAEDEAEE